MHRLLGVQPRASDVAAPPAPSTRHVPTANGPRQASASITEAWRAASESNDEHGDSRASGSKNATREIISVSSDSEEESRYEVPGPPTKRRRLGTAADAHTVFTADEDEDLQVSSDSENGGLQELIQEEGQYTDADSSESDDGEAAVRRQNKRAYWAAKAAVGVTDVDSD